MNFMYRLYCFELLHGNRIAINELLKQYGWRKAFGIVAKLKWRIWFNNPFQDMNSKKKPNATEKASQHQMAPAIVLYDILKEMGVSEDQALANLQSLVITVATAFLKFNVPIILPSHYEGRDDAYQMGLFQKITARFFNATGDLARTSDRQMTFTVNKCLFAQYSHSLGYPQLAKVFCSADKHFFDQHQPNIVFERSVTLAEHRKPCDFSFKVAVENTK